MNISKYTLNSVVPALWQMKVHVIVRSSVVLAWIHDERELV